MGYTQLTEPKRYQIYALKKAGHKQFEIASLLEVHKSTICREFKRNSGKRGYRPQQAHEFAHQRKVEKYAPRISADSWLDIKSLIEADLSPDQVSVWLKYNTDIRVSPERIYQYIQRDKANGGMLFTHLRCQKKRRKKYGSNSLRGQIVNRVSIDERPKIVDEKNRVGDWEVDTIIGGNHKQAIVTLTERKTRYTLLRKVRRRTADQVANAIVEMLTPYLHNVLTITADNGKEFANHEKVSRDLNVDFYFAHPYSSYERGLNENTNGLIRQYFPKGSDFRLIKDGETEKVIAKLNSRPRKCLGYKTPNQMFLWH